LETSSWLLLFPDAFPMPTIPKPTDQAAHGTAEFREMEDYYLCHFGG
jgi:hypothetical protein